MTETVRRPDLQRGRSKELYERALRVEPNGVGGSDIRGPRGGWEPFPIFMARGDGAYLEDVDGNRYLDFLAAYGPLILGYQPRRVIAAVHRTMDDMGPLLGFNHELEVAAAEAAVECVPSWEQVRFCNTGTEAVMLALRVARAYTGRTKVLRFEGHFHGWTDLIHFSANADAARAATDSQLLAPVPATGGMVGSLADTLVLRQWNDADLLRKTFTEVGDELAAVICEPLLASSSVIPPKAGYLELLRELTEKHGVVLIYDEVKTGFRVALGGAQELYGVLPDLSTAAKALGAGFPVAAVGGRRELFEPFTRGYASQGSTYQANPMALAAVIATLSELREPGFYPRITSLGNSLSAGLTALAAEAGVPSYTRGVGSILQPVFADHKVENYRDFVRSHNGTSYHEFWRAMLDGGVICGPRPGACWFVSGAHTGDDITKALEVARIAFRSIASRPA